MNIRQKMLACGAVSIIATLLVGASASGGRRC